MEKKSEIKGASPGSNAAGSGYALQVLAEDGSGLSASIPHALTHNPKIQ